MKTNSKVYDLLSTLSVSQLESLVKHKKNEVYKTKLNIIKKSMISKKLDCQLDN